jgi:hypothetical protein
VTNVIFSKDDLKIASILHALLRCDLGTSIWFSSPWIRDDLSDSPVRNRSSRHDTVILRQGQGSFAIPGLRGQNAHSQTLPFRVIPLRAQPPCYWNHKPCNEAIYMCFGQCCSWVQSSGQPVQTGEKKLLRWFQPEPIKSSCWGLRQCGSRSSLHMLSKSWPI